MSFRPQGIVVHFLSLIFECELRVCFLYVAGLFLCSIAAFVLFSLVFVEALYFGFRQQRKYCWSNVRLISAPHFVV